MPELSLNDQQTLAIIIMASVFFSGLIVFLITYLNRQQKIQHLQQQLQQNTEQLDLQLNQQKLSLALSEQKQQQLQMNLDQVSNLLQQRNNDYGHVTERLQQALKQLELTKLEAKKDREFHQAQLDEISQQRKRLNQEFEQLAQSVLKQTQQDFSQNSHQQLDAFLKPFRQQVSDFREKVENIHSSDLKQREALKTELVHLQQLNRAMTEEAHNLSTALKGQKKMQGNWGELILENVLDRSGLRIDTDYRREVSFTTAEGRKRPDVIVYLPDQRHLVIDAKVSLNAYTEYVNAEDELQRQAALKAHIQAMTDRINELSDKNYYDLPGTNAPEMVFMFVPIESAFVEAVKAEPRLFELAINQKILVTTPTTLLTSLNIVRQIWRFEDQNKYSAQLADQAARVYNQLRLFLESLQTLGEQLDRSRKTYETAMNQFISGRGNLVKRVEDFQKLGVAVKKELPADLVEKAGLELDLIEPSKDSQD